MINISLKQYVKLEFQKIFNKKGSQRLPLNYKTKNF